MFHFLVCLFQGGATPDAEYDYVDDVFFDSPPVSPTSLVYTPSTTFFDAPSTLQTIAERSKLSEGNYLFMTVGNQSIYVISPYSTKQYILATLSNSV